MKKIFIRKQALILWLLSIVLGLLAACGPNSLTVDTTYDYYCPGETVQFNVSGEKRALEVRFLSADKDVLGEISLSETLSWTSPILFPEMSPILLETYRNNSWIRIGQFHLDFVKNGDALELEQVEFSERTFIHMTPEVKEGEPGSQWGEWGRCTASHQELIDEYWVTECIPEECYEDCDSDCYFDKDGNEVCEEVCYGEVCECPSGAGIPSSSGQCCYDYKEQVWETVCDEQEWIPETYWSYPVLMGITELRWITADIAPPDSKIMLTEVTNNTKNIRGSIVVLGGTNDAVVFAGETDIIEIPLTNLTAFMIEPLIANGDYIQCGSIDVPAGEEKPTNVEIEPCTTLPDSTGTKLSFNMSCSNN